MRLHLSTQPPFLCHDHQGVSGRETIYDTNEGQCCRLCHVDEELRFHVRSQLDGMGCQSELDSLDVQSVKDWLAQY